MRKLRTLPELMSALSDELVWRQTEIVNLRMEAATAKELARKAILRAGVALAYAHWEGFVKCSTELLLNYVANQKLKNNELSRLFLMHSLKGHVNLFMETSKVEAAIQLVDALIEKMNECAAIRYKNSIRTESNLSSIVFDNIAKSVGVDVSSYLHLYPFIDETILNKRNSIAHGESMDVGLDEFKRISDRVVDLMRMYKTDIANIACLRSFARQVQEEHA